MACDLSCNISFSLLPLLASLQEVPQLLDSSEKEGICLPNYIHNDTIGENKIDAFKTTISTGLTISKAIFSPTKVI